MRFRVMRMPVIVSTDGDVVIPDLIRDLPRMRCEPRRISKIALLLAWSVVAKQRDSESHSAPLRTGEFRMTMAVGSEWKYALSWFW